MKHIGQVATYPARIGNLPAMIESVAGQLDELHVVLNQYSRRLRSTLPRLDNVKYVVPDADLKDTGKFLRLCSPDDLVFLMDDDLIFPPDYVSKLAEFHRRLPSRRAVVGLHGVTYSDLFEGAASSRFVAKFDKALERPVVVNQLGTGCLMVPGEFMPPFAYMESSQRFVDVRFARWCKENDIACICINRPAGWMVDQEPEDSIFESYTRMHHREQLDEILSFAGFGNLNARLALAVERL